jgi:hypothetical protein
MSLHPIDRSEIPEKIAELGHKLLGENNMYRLIGDRLAELVKDEDFIDMYSSIGGPALSPVILSFVLIFQMLEKLPDRLAAEAVRLRIDWKYALHLPLDWGIPVLRAVAARSDRNGFHPATRQTANRLDERARTDSQAQPAGNDMGNAANGVESYPGSR